MKFVQSMTVIYYRLVPWLRDYFEIWDWIRKRVHRVPNFDFVGTSPIAEKIRPEDVVLEAGTNMGGLTRELADRAAEVHTFDPNKSAIDFARAHVGRKNVKFYNLAISSDDGESWLNYATAFDGANSIYEPKGWTGRVSYMKRLRIRTTSIRSFVERTGVRPTVLVMDAEGSEVPAMEGAGKYLPDRLFMETHELVQEDGTIRNTLPACEEFLSRRGYSVRIFRDKGGVPWIEAVR